MTGDRRPQGSGYSTTPLWKKLGIVEGVTVTLLDAPENFRRLIAGHPPDVEFATDGIDGADIVICFSTTSARLLELFERAMSLIPATGSIWVAWPKRRSGVPTDITEDRLRELLLPTGLVDVKVCAIDETWSGLKFSVRREHRQSWQADGRRA